MGIGRIMDAVEHVDFLRSREVNVPYEGFKGALRELYREGPLTIVSAAAIGAAIGALVVLGASLFAAGGSVGMAALPLIELTAGASAVLTTLFVGTRGYLEGRHEALKKNALIDHMADLHHNETALRGFAVERELEAETARREGPAPEFIKKIVEGGQKASAARRAETILAMRSEADGSAREF